jgi:cytidylate kinase
MAVIAMTREMGSLGRDIALELAEDLNLTLVQHEVVDHVADKMHLGASTVNRFLEGKARLLERWGMDDKTASLYTAEEIFDLASQGNVLIRGWGATYLLRPVTHVLCVRVCAPVKQRAGVIMERIGIQDERTAIREIEKNDAAHAKTMHHLFHADWRDPLLYDVVVNTSRISVEAGVSLIKELINRPEFNETAQSRAQLATMKLEAQVRSALRSNPKTQRLNTLFDIALEPDRGKITLSGVVDDDALHHEALKTISAVPGINEVDDRLLVATHFRYGP